MIDGATVALQNISITISDFVTKYNCVLILISGEKTKQLEFLQGKLSPVQVQTRRNVWNYWLTWYTHVLKRR